MFSCWCLVSESPPAPGLDLAMTFSFCLVASSVCRLSTQKSSGNWLRHSMNAILRKKDSFFLNCRRSHLLLTVILLWVLTANQAHDITIAVISDPYADRGCSKADPCRQYIARWNGVGFKYMSKRVSLWVIEKTRERDKVVPDVRVRAGVCVLCDWDQASLRMSVLRRPWYMLHYCAHSKCVQPKECKNASAYLYVCVNPCTRESMCTHECICFQSHIKFMRQYHHFPWVTQRCLAAKHSHL